MGVNGMDIQPGDSKAKVVPDGVLDYSSTPLQTQFFIARNNMEMRKGFLERVTRLFIWTNASVVFLIGLALAIDVYLISHGYLNPKEGDQRLVGEKVLLALIGATTVQLGGIAYMISSYLFPKSPGKE